VVRPLMKHMWLMLPNWEVFSIIIWKAICHVS